jgi:oligopeptidase A
MLQNFAQKLGHLGKLSAWDIPYYSEKLRERMGISDEMVRVYFPIERVLNGLFGVLDALFQIKVVESAVEVWHPNVRFFTLFDAKGDVRGQIYMDLYARPKKQEGAWLDDAYSRRKLNAEIVTPIAFLVCNFTPPTSKHSALLTHDEVLTLFHEMGHALQHVLTQVDYVDVAGIHGVPWDAVEFPSQFLECFAWEASVLKQISGHYQTGEPLPMPLMQKMREAKDFQAGLQLLRQIEFALFDFQLHSGACVKGEVPIQEIIDNIRHRVSVILVPKFNRFQNCFSHIFAGGYAAGYYSYLWAEVLAWDAFERFEEEGSEILNPSLGQAFLKAILEQGGAVDALVLFEQFRKRPPEPKAFLRNRGIGAPESA